MHETCQCLPALGAKQPRGDAHGTSPRLAATDEPHRAW